MLAWISKHNQEDIRVTSFNEIKMRARILSKKNGGLAYQITRNRKHFIYHKILAMRGI